MSGSLERAVRRVLGTQIVPTLILCVLTPFFVDPASHFRVAGSVLALGLPVGLACFGVILVVLAYQMGRRRHRPSGGPGSRRPSGICPSSSFTWSC